MKTILVVYTDVKLTKKEWVSKKQYAFNSSTAKVGDLVQSDDYSTAMQVVMILDKCYKYVNLSTGELSDKRNSTNQFELRRLDIQRRRSTKSCDDNVVKAEVVL